MASSLAPTPSCPPGRSPRGRPGLELTEGNVKLLHGSVDVLPVLDVIDVDGPLLRGDDIDDAVLPNSISNVPMQPPLQPFDVRSGKRVVLQRIQPRLNAGLNRWIKLLVLPHRMR